MIKIIIGLLTVIIIAGIAGHFWQQSQQDTDAVSQQIETKTAIPDSAQASVETTSVPTVHEAAHIEEIDRKIKQIEAEVNEDKQSLKQFEDEQQAYRGQRAEIKALINMVAPISAVEQDGIAAKMAAKTWIALDLDQLAEAKQGDQFDLPPVDGQAYQAIITQKKTLWNGDQSLRAKIYSPNGEPYPLIMSANPQNGFLTYSTPQGTFEANLKDGVGAVYSVSDIDRATENGKHNDVIDIRDL